MSSLTVGIIHLSASADRGGDLLSRRFSTSIKLWLCTILLGIMAFADLRAPLALFFNKPGGYWRAALGLRCYGFPDCFSHDFYRISLPAVPGGIHNAVVKSLPCSFM